MTANKPMTGEQLDELMTVAVNMQRDSEKAGNRPSAMFAYAVQVVVLELRKVRDDAAELEQKLAESQREFRAADATIENLQMQVEKLAAENAGLKDFVKTCFRAAADGASLDGAYIQELGERLGLFGRETYQPALHGYICGHEAGEDTVYVMKKTPATDAFLAEVRAQGVEMFAKHCQKRHGEMMKYEPNEAASNQAITATRRAGEFALYFAAQLRKGVQS
ncbi:hypothetical protein [Enterobacter hormaechei]|uniref:hypothetical protein n=1 Tax=Enterobacter hormaechei TaxID=158836 RepID=UPI0007989422|nr:hypothetical protein [Enterobacter hormaechei]CZW29502.1 Uncharacterised protein [Enterobacter hormaechei]